MPRAAALLAVLAAVVPGAASASQLIDRNASAIKLEVNRQGQALLSYRVGSLQRHVLVWGAVDALAPNASVPQVDFRVDYSGGWGTYRKLVWKTFKNACGPYTGPEVQMLVTACTAPDGSYWAVQSWQRGLPDLGFTPWLPLQSAYELRISHWTGPMASLEVHSDWVWNGRWQELFGRMTYQDQPVHGFKTTSTGVPLDSYGRNLYLDTYDSAYGPGWRRENGFVVHKPNGNFCYGFYPFKVASYAHPKTIASGLRGPGVGSQYRITVIGPGVTPDILWEGTGLHPYDPRSLADVQLEEQMNSLRAQLAAGDHSCTKH
jgi:hypothetical protein